MVLYHRDKVFGVRVDRHKRIHQRIPLVARQRMIPSNELRSRRLGFLTDIRQAFDYFRVDNPG